jgi:hypothetical protein
LLKMVWLIEKTPELLQKYVHLTKDTVKAAIFVSVVLFGAYSIF